jgi:hypothetical protein
MKQGFRVIIFISLLTCSRISANEHHVHYSLRKEVITVNSIETGYSSSVYCRGEFTSLIGRESNISYNELEAIGGIKARYKNERGKYKDLPEENIQNTSVMGGSLYGGTNKYVLSWPSKGKENLSFLYTYRLNCKELMTLASLLTNDIDATDTFEYDVRVPVGIFLYFKLPEGVTEVKVDSTKTDAGMIYHFTSMPVRPINLVGELQEYEEYSFPPRAIRLILVPASYEHRPWNWLNDWFRTLIHQNPELSKECIKSIEDQKGGSSDPDSIASRLFVFVQNKITYIDVENGLGAFKPRESDKVFQNRQGDCKDMASLLCDALNANGIEAYRAISSSISHETDMDFPSLSSGNHMICVAHIGGRWRYLDATDPVCAYGYPSMHIQGRKIYIINDHGGTLEKVPIVEAGLNESRCTIDLHQSGTTFEGDFTYALHGLSMHDERILKFMHSEADGKAATIKALKDLSHNTLFTDVTSKELDTVLVISGKMKAENEIASLDGKYSLRLDFLPFPHKYPKHPDEGTKLINYQTIDNRFECRITLDSTYTLRPFEKVHYSKEGFIFDFSVTQSGTKNITIRYSYSYNDVVIPEEKQKNYTELNLLIQQTLNRLIIYE